jgi:hypothetical protein
MQIFIPRPSCSRNLITQYYCVDKEELSYPAFLKTLLRARSGSVHAANRRQFQSGVQPDMIPDGCPPSVDVWGTALS